MTTSLILPDSELVTRRHWLVGTATVALAGLHASELTLGQNVGPSILGAYRAYNGKCICGRSAGGAGNCAHYLGDALIRNGFNELLSGYETSGCAARAGSKRPVRAKEMREWFFKRRFRLVWRGSKPPKNTGFYLVYQQDGNQGHVLVYNSLDPRPSYARDLWRGTGFYPAWKTAQEYYQ